MVGRKVRKGNLMPDERKCPRCGEKQERFGSVRCPNSGCSLPYLVWNDWAQLQRNLDKARAEVERLIAFVRDQDCCCVNEFGQNRTSGPCDRCKLLGEDGRKHILAGKLTLEEAQRTNCCRICGKSVHAPFILNYGAEFAHEKCLRGEI